MRGLLLIAIAGVMVLPSAAALAYDGRHPNRNDRNRMHITDHVPIVSRAKWEECKDLNAYLSGRKQIDKPLPELMRQCKNLRKGGG